MRHNILGANNKPSIREIAYRCNKCGNVFMQYEHNGEAINVQGFAVFGDIGYGSKYDGESIRMRICQDCMDKLIESCAVSPIVGDNK